MAIHGETPYVYEGPESHYRRLWYSRPEQALIRDITLQPGYGVLKEGTILALNNSAAGNKNKYVPYRPTTPAASDTENQKGRAFLVAQPSGTTCYVTQDDSYKFSVGDDLIVNDANSTAENLGAITAIDRTTYQHMAMITFTETISGTFTVAQSAWVGVEAGDSSNDYSDAKGILASSVDTGTGEHAKGAVAPMVMKNAILYYGMIIGNDSAARTDLSASQNGNYFVF